MELIAACYRNECRRARPLWAGLGQAPDNAPCEPTHNDRDDAVRSSQAGRGITGGYRDHSFTSCLRDNNDDA